MAGLRHLGVGVLLVVVSAAVLAVMSARADTLLHEGDRVPGEVTGEWRMRYGGGFTVAYTYAGERYDERVSAREPEPEVSAGDEVTVVVDPRDPDRIRTTEHANTVRWWTFLPIMGLILGPVLTLIGVVVLAGELRRRWRWRSAARPAPAAPPGVSRRVARRVRRDVGDDADRVLAALEELRREPSCRVVVPERLHAGVVLAARGTAEGYDDAMRLARTDWRDLLVAAGLADADWRAELDRRLGRD